MKIGVVATFARAQPVLPSWLAALRQLAVSHFYLFADQASEYEPSLALVPAAAKVYARNAPLRALWELTPSWAAAGAYCERQVYARQCLNVDVAIAQARADGLDWLLHIDLDELPYCEQPGQTLAEALGLHREHDLVTLVNHEAVPQRWHIENYFDEVNLFKRNPAQLTDAQKVLAARQFGADYFYAYANGKSLMNLHGSCRHSHGAHLFAPAGRSAVAQGFSLLHYAHCGFNWYYDKYQTLGNFESDLLGHGDMPKAFPLMAESRAAVVNADVHSATRIYQQRLMAQGGLPASLPCLLEAGVLFYNRQPTFDLI